LQECKDTILSHSIPNASSQNSKPWNGHTYTMCNWVCRFRTLKGRSIWLACSRSSKTELVLSHVSKVAGARSQRYVLQCCLTRLSRHLYLG
jgi:hypothetical protein